MIFHCEICNIILYPKKITYTLYLTNPQGKTALPIFVDYHNELFKDVYNVYKCKHLS